MNKLLVTFGLIFMLSACGTNPVARQEIVTVDRPIALIVPPPTVPVFQSQIDLLMDDDIIQPGKVGKAYNHDVTFLRSLVKIQQMIIDQYKQESQNFDQVNIELAKLKSKSQIIVDPK